MTNTGPADGEQVLTGARRLVTGLVVANVLAAVLLIAGSVFLRQLTIEATNRVDQRTEAFKASVRLAMLTERRTSLAFGNLLRQDPAMTAELEQIREEFTRQLETVRALSDEEGAALVEEIARLDERVVQPVEKGDGAGLLSARARLETWQQAGLHITQLVAHQEERLARTRAQMRARRSAFTTVLIGAPLLGILFAVAAMAVWLRTQRMVRSGQTALRDVEARAADFERESAAAFEQLGVGAGRMSVDGRWQRTSPVLTAMLGGDEAQVAAHTREAMSFPGDDGFARAFKLVSDHQEMPSVSVRQRLRRVDGRALETQLTVTRVAHADGRVSHFMILIEDRTAERRAERRLRVLSQIGRLVSSTLQPEAPLATSLEVLAEELGVSVALQLEADRPLFCATPAGQRPLDLGPLPDLVGAGLSRLLLADVSTPEFTQQAENAPGLLKALRAADATLLHTVEVSGSGAPYGTLLLISTRGGVQLDPSQAQLAGDVAALFSSALENARLYASAEQALAVREEFISCASHELRTPLTALDLHLRILKSSVRQALGEGFEEVSPKFDVLSRQSGRLAHLVSTLTQVTTVSAGALHLREQPVDLTAHLSEALDRLQPLLDESHCPLRRKLEPTGIGLWDPLRVEQILTNLVHNASKFGAGHPVEVSLLERDGQVRLSVRDHGPGISESEQARLFQRYARGAGAAHTGGLGLGLYISRNLAEQMGGQLVVETSPEGSRLTAMLPLKRPEAS